MLSQWSVYPDKPWSTLIFFKELNEDLKENKYISGTLPDNLDDDSLSEIFHKTHILTPIPSKESSPLFQLN